MSNSWNIQAQLPHWDGISEPITYMGTSLIPPGGQRNFDMVDVVCTIKNGREATLTLDENGCQLVSSTTAIPTEQFYQPSPTNMITETYYKECCTLVQNITGASKVFAFDHNVRHANVALFAERKAERKTRIDTAAEIGNTSLALPDGKVRFVKERKTERKTRKESAAEIGNTSLAGPDGPVRFVHNDYTDVSGPQRVKDLSIPGGSYTTDGALFSEKEANEILKSRFCFVNCWRPINQPVIDVPLAVCDAQSMIEDDFAPCKLVYPNRIGQTHIIKHESRHVWHWFPYMTRDECLLLKCWDSDKSSRKKCRYTAHTAFANPVCPLNAPPRESIEVRCLLIFNDGDNEDQQVVHQSNL